MIDERRMATAHRVVEAQKALRVFHDYDNAMLG
jgi:hypothetical protein